MFRPSPRRIALTLLGLGMLCASPATRAQATFGNISSDPFAFYYAYYLPNQQMQAMRPRPDDSINMAVQQRQYYAAAQKPTLYDPISPYTAEPYDPTKPYSRDKAKERVANPYRFVTNPSNASGTGPSLYYGRASQYFPTLRAGFGPNSSLPSGARRLGGGGRMNMQGLSPIPGGASATNSGMGGVGGMGGMGGFGGGMGGFPG